jgi:hypothetical protein
MDADKVNRPEPWPTLIHESRTIVAADVVSGCPFQAPLELTSEIYDPDLVPPLVSTLRVLLENNPKSIALVAATVRNKSTLQLFVDTCSE